MYYNVYIKESDAAVVRAAAPKIRRLYLYTKISEYHVLYSAVISSAR